MHKQRGFTLLEVQMAVAALALGFSVMTYAYMAVSQTSSHVYYRHGAMQVVKQITQTLPHYPDDVAGLVAYSQTTRSNASSAHAPNHCFAGAICTEQAMLLAWWRTWQRSLLSLPQGQLSLQCVSTCHAGHVLNVQITWQAPSQAWGASANPPINMEPQVDPNECDPQGCLQINWPLH